MKILTITLGMSAMVDDEDFEYLSQFKWYPLLDSSTGNYYATRNISLGDKKYSTKRMHREIMNTPKTMKCDHINHNTLDNRKENLRNVTTSQSGMNRRKPKNNKSGYKGVHLKSGKYWQATVDSCGKHVFCKTFSSAFEAAKAYDREARKYHGEYAVLNFPEAE